jgi:tungstate transport system permease protein
VGEVWQGVTDAVRLLLAGDREVVEVTLRSLWVSGLALALALALGVPLGGLLAALEFPGRRLAVAAVNTGMAAPPVVVGLLVVLALTRNGPLGGLRLLYTGQAMVVAQTLIALPVVTGLVLAALQQVDPGLRQQLAALGAGRLQTLLLLLREVRVALLAAVMAAFGAVISEVGAVMMVGGNIRGQTQVLTTAIVQETRSGRYAAAIALAVVLMALAFAANLALTVLQQRGRRRTG